MAEKLTTLAKRLRPFIAGQAGAMAAVGAFMQEGPGIDLVGNIIGLGGDTILIYKADGTPVQEFAFTYAGLVQATNAAVSGDVIKLPAGTITASSPTLYEYSPYNPSAFGDILFVYRIKDGVKLIGEGKNNTTLNITITYPADQPGDDYYAAHFPNAVAVYCGGTVSYDPTQTLQGQIEGVHVNATFTNVSSTGFVIYGGYIKHCKATGTVPGGGTTPRMELVACFPGGSSSSTVIAEDLEIYGTGGTESENIGFFSGFSSVPGIVRNISIRGSDFWEGYETYYKSNEEGIYVNITGHKQIFGIYPSDTLSNSYARVSSDCTMGNASDEYVGIYNDWVIVSCYGYALSASETDFEYDKTVGIFNYGFAVGCIGEGDVNYPHAGSATGFLHGGQDAEGCTGFAWNDVGFSYSVYLDGSPAHSISGEFTIFNDDEGLSPGTRTFSTTRETTLATYNLDEYDEFLFCDATSNNITANLPSIVGICGRRYTISRIDGSANTVTVVPDGSETINGNASISLILDDSMSIIATVSEWRIV